MAKSEVNECAGASRRGIVVLMITLAALVACSSSADAPATPVAASPTATATTAPLSVGEYVVWCERTESLLLPAYPLYSDAAWSNQVIAKIVADGLIEGIQRSYADRANDIGTQRHYDAVQQRSGALLEEAHSVRPPESVAELHATIIAGIELLRDGESSENKDADYFRARSIDIDDRRIALVRALENSENSTRAFDFCPFLRTAGGFLRKVGS